MRKKILLTGSQGYLGQHLVRALEAYGMEPIACGRREQRGVVQCDMMDRDAVARLFEKHNPDQIIHAAACVPKSLSEYQDSLNADQNLRMIDNIVSSSCASVILISSMTVYGEQTNISRIEEDAGNPQSDYGKSKLDGELLLEQAGMNGFAVRIPGLFGGNRSEGIVYNLVASIKNKTEPDLPNLPILWAAMDVFDAAESIAKLAATPVAGFKPINIGYTDIYSINRLVESVSQIMSEPVDYSVIHPEFSFNLELAKTMGVAPKVELAEALKKLIKSV